MKLQCWAGVDQGNVLPPWNPKSSGPSINPVRGALGFELQPERPDGLRLRQGMAGKVLVGHTSRVQGNGLGAP